MPTPFKLRCTVSGHSKDIRGLCSFQGGFISCSRDSTARVWREFSSNDFGTENSLGFTEAQCLRGHKKFVSCVCVTPPDDSHPEGLIITGSNDHTIAVFSMTSSQPLYKLIGHTENVCALTTGKYGTILSGSWDKTAKVWLNEKCVMTLESHTAAVWCVAILPEKGLMLSGSADKSIKIWKAGKCEKTLTGHTDCVRSIAIKSSHEFFSCGNDATIRLWTIAGDCTNIIYGHSNYIYCISMMNSELNFVTSSEDRTIKIWENGECVQTIAHPCQSIWAVCTLPNNDIVTGSSDGMIRVFSRATDRQADQSIQEIFDNEVSSSQIPSEIGDIKKEDVSGPEVLLNPGKSDGQSVMVREGAKITAHQWSASEGRWHLIGEVVGSNQSGGNSGSKQSFEGKEYDYVFSVDVEEGKPPLKLPYNKGDDVWVSAHKFLERNQLSPMFLDQVAKFITQQTAGINGSNTPQSSPSNYTDPFTGGARYLPGTDTRKPGGAGSTDPLTGGTRHVPQNSSESAKDPFTGSSAYHSSSADQIPVNFVKSLYSPQTTFIKFDSCKTAALFAKLTEFSKLSDNSVSDIKTLETLVETSDPTEEQIGVLKKFLKLPQEHIFPVLDLLRLCVLKPYVGKHMFSKEQAILAFLSPFISTTSSSPNRMLALRCLTNAFVSPHGESLLLSSADEIMVLLENMCNATRNEQIALTSLLLNYAVAAGKCTDADSRIEIKTRITSTAVNICEKITDAEACYRLLICMVTLFTDDKDMCLLAVSMDANTFVRRCKDINDPSKVAECAEHISKMFQRLN